MYAPGKRLKYIKEMHQLKIDIPAGEYKDHKVDNYCAAVKTNLLQIDYLLN
jgi:hypothetical protein